MLELLILILLVLLIFGGFRYRAHGDIFADPIGIVLVVIIVLILISFVTPFPYYHRLF